MSVVPNINCNDALRRLEQINRKVIAGVEILGRSTAHKLEAEAKSPQGVPYRPMSDFEEQGIFEMSHIDSAKAKQYAEENKDNMDYTMFYKFINQTAQTRNTTQGKSEWADSAKNVMVISVGSDSPQAAYLEYANEGKFAFLRPAVDKYKEDTMKRFQKIVQTGNDALDDYI